MEETVETHPFEKKVNLRDEIRVGGKLNAKSRIEGGAFSATS
jgi:hypothetical protein